MIKTNKIINLIISATLFVSICVAEPSNTSNEVTKEQSNSDIVQADNVQALFVEKLQGYLEKNDTDGAIALFQELPEELSNDINLKSLLGALYYSNGEFDNAIKVGREIVEKDSRNIDALELLSMSYKAKGGTEARNAYKTLSDKILKNDPYNPTINVQKGDELALSKKWKQAQTYYGKALRGDKNNISALLGYAKMAYYLDDLKTANTFLERILDIDPLNAPALAYKGTIEFDKENFLTASQYAEVALKIDPYNYDYWLDYGTYLRYQGRYDEAEKAWNKAIEIDPNYFLAYENLAGIYDEQNLFDKALENYRNVIRTNPKYFYAYETTAILEYHAGNYKEAIKYFQEAYKYNPSYSYSLMTAACYFKLKDPFNAKKILKAQMKKLNRGSVEYELVRFFHDSYSRNAESTLIRKINALESSNERGKMLFYMGLYNEIHGSEIIAQEFYSQVLQVKAPMFFEYRIAEWGMK